MTVSTIAIRPLWLRVLQFPPTRIVLLGGIIFYMMAVNNGFMEDFKATPVVAIAITIGMGGLAMAIYAGWGRFIERREVTELSLPGMGREWATGALIGAGLFASCAMILMMLGMYRIEGLNPLSFLIPAVAMALSSGIFEELFFRGVVFRSVEDLFGSWISLVVSSLVFGFIHLLNPGGTIEGAIYISIEAGLLLAAAYLLTRRLWMSIGFHMAWNYTQSAIFSGVVSGGVTLPGLIRDVIEGPDLLTGGSFGLESSVIALVLCTTAGVILLMIAVRRGHILPPPWKR
ncbi:CPBP family intramembrane metalloprotease [Cereibacter sphaeroides]|uniref:CPBP family intramembrane glutamic endopeptidase n=1 Tax=Cereibacter sphaeroides TaxID=1063 RepID=UPI001F289056|nr:CPBP family intramembrane glutamic endopeptidase [Cereibacter sphaeroides]MCE6957710.1 CPBP family intramembrane metalloprotease [Cereibacter sphaeroides]MCE6967264.1 CPBP family intramembrane metalloprotease [Cereibacter sphaeroides]MCE6971475.1 CPBP family intramembrane metalloprotease [Cereibacter sphaeroides]